MNTFKYNLGDEVQDKVTKFKGIVRSRSEYMTGCNRYGVQSQKLKEDKPTDWVWFDETEISLIKKQKIKLGEQPEKKTDTKKIKGGPMSNNHTPPQN